MSQALAASTLLAAAMAHDAPSAGHEFSAAAAFVQPLAGEVLMFEDEEYSFPLGSLNGVKCCTKCGATKTPQWREGPCGPKTLCNACGVKRTRKLRAEQEGAKRRKLSVAPAAAPQPGAKLFASASTHKYGGSRAAAAYAEAPRSIAGLAMDSYGSLEPDFEAWGLAAPAPQAAASTRRLPRRAAEEAAVRTAHYARTGEWAGEAGDAGEDGLRAATPSSSSDFSLPSSSCPEEVSWPPPPGAGGADCYAAVNLMTMSAKQAQQAQQQQASQAQQAQQEAAAHYAAAALAAGVPPPAACCTAGSGAASPSSRTASQSQQAGHGLEPEQFNHDSMVVMAAKYEGPCGAAPHHHKVVPVDFAELSRCLPPAKVLELLRLNGDLEMAVHEAHAANAAVAAVAQVLAAKQAAALRSREVAGAATKRLRRFMAELDTQFGIQSKFAGGAAARQQPLSPARPAAGLASPSVLPSAAPLSPVPPMLLPPQLPAAPALAGF